MKILAIILVGIIAGVVAEADPEAWHPRPGQPIYKRDAEPEADPWKARYQWVKASTAVKLKLIRGKRESDKAFTAVKLKLSQPSDPDKAFIAVKLKLSQPSDPDKAFTAVKLKLSQPSELVKAFSAEKQKLSQNRGTQDFITNTTVRDHHVQSQEFMLFRDLIW
ncbi:hypothetical protein RUND412_009517 [Rhizina undulata]